MGPELGREFYHLWNECAWLHMNWQEYVILFGTKDSRLELLNSAAGAFFRIVHDTLWEATLLHLCRLTDPPRSGGKENLTLQRLPSLAAEKIRPSVQQHLDVVLEKCEFARDWRKRHIAHRDLQLAISENAIPLAPASRLTVRHAIEAIADMMNAVEEHYRKSTVAHGIIPPAHHADALPYVLRDGLAMEQRRQQLLEAGAWNHPDANPPAV